ncbi:MAG: hypothetical protein ACR2OG_05515 [Gemmatimonadaceae bacterium]
MSPPVAGPSPALAAALRDRELHRDAVASEWTDEPAVARPVRTGRSAHESREQPSSDAPASEMPHAESVPAARSPEVVDVARVVEEETPPAESENMTVTIFDSPAALFRDDAVETGELDSISPVTGEFPAESSARPMDLEREEDYLPRTGEYPVYRSREEKARARGFQQMAQEAPVSPTLEWNRSSVEISAPVEETPATTAPPILPMDEPAPAEQPALTRPTDFTDRRVEAGWAEIATTEEEPALPRSEEIASVAGAAPPSSLGEVALETGDVERTKEMEPWVLPPTSPGDTGLMDRIATALERVAGRVRTGDVRVASGGDVDSDEAALALALAALFRSRR